MNLTGKQLRAIDFYAKDKGLRLTICNPPQMKFLQGDPPTLIDVTLEDVMKVYEAHLKERRRESAKANRQRSATKHNPIRRIT